MFNFYLHVLRKNGVVKNRFLTIATISLFLLCTVYCALLLAATEIANVINGSAELSRQSLQIYVSLNRVEHDLRDQQIFRCYAIWNFRWNIVILPIVMTIIGAAFGYLNVIVSLQTTAVFDPLYATFSGGLPAFLFTLSISLSVLTTVILMGLSGRAEFGGSQAEHVCLWDGRLESGALYCVGGIAFAIISAYELSGRLNTDTLKQLSQLTDDQRCHIGPIGGNRTDDHRRPRWIGQSIESVDSFGAATPSHAVRARRQLQSAGVPAAAPSTE
ncbi:hypothetical protein B0H13DRAFT_1900452 [Mycena leptocephala]|nr:hypothetical protein B0H13DRAFT_1900452 [Mycena leptocephala]